MTPSMPRPPASSENARHTMQANRSANTGPEIELRGMLRAAGFTGYRLHWKVPGRPDIAYPGRKVAIFVHGCFWHSCPSCQPVRPKANAEFWAEKLDANIARDARNRALLEIAGWKVVTIWECELRDRPEAALNRAIGVLRRSREST